MEENLFEELFHLIEVLPQEKGTLEVLCVNEGDPILKGQIIGRMEGGKEIQSTVNGKIHSLQEIGKVYDIE